MFKSKAILNGRQRREVSSAMKKNLFKVLSLYLVSAMMLLTLPAQGWAMFIPADNTAAVKKGDLVRIQQTLETTAVKQRLKDLGLSSEEAMARLNSLSDEQIHQLAANIDSVQAGGDGVGALIFLLLVAIIVVVILQASGHRVIVR